MWNLFLLFVVSAVAHAGNATHSVATYFTAIE